MSCGLYLFPSTYAQFDRRETSVLYKPSLSRTTSPSAISLEDLEGPSNRLIRTVWMWSFRISNGDLGRPPHSSRRYVRETVRGAKAAPVVKIIAASAESLLEPRSTINYILGGPVEDQYQSKNQKKRLLRVATVWARVSTIHIPDSSGPIRPIDDLISFPLINLSRVITPHHDALLLTLCINNFHMHRVLVDLGSVADLLQLPAFWHMNFSFNRLSSYGRILFGLTGQPQ